MSLRQIELIVTRDEYEKAMDTIEKAAGEDDLTWVSLLKDGKVSVMTIMEMVDIESLTDVIEKRFHVSSGYRIVIHPIEAVLPRIPEPEDEEAKQQKARRAARLSREELYARAQDMCQFSRPIATLVVLSTIVAVIGLRMNSEAITLAAMIIAPLMGPNVALALATTLGDRALARKSMVSAIKGLALAAVAALILGLLIPVNPDNATLQSRTNLDFFVVVLALVSGAAGVVSFTSGAAAALVGVMVSLAILPPLATAAILLSKGLFIEGAKAAILCLVNIIGLNLAGVATFMAHGIRPTSWWEAKRARRMAITAMAAWTGLLCVMIGVIYVYVYILKPK